MDAKYVGREQVRQDAIVSAFKKAKGDVVNAKKELDTAIRNAEKAPFADLEEAKKVLASL